MTEEIGPTRTWVAGENLRRDQVTLVDEPQLWAEKFDAYEAMDAEGRAKIARDATAFAALLHRIATDCPLWQDEPCPLGMDEKTCLEAQDNGEVDYEACWRALCYKLAEQRYHLEKAAMSDPIKWVRVDRLTRYGRHFVTGLYPTIEERMDALLNFDAVVGYNTYVHVHIEPVLRHIDSDRYVWHFDVCERGTVRAQFAGTGAPAYYARLAVECAEQLAADVSIEPESVIEPDAPWYYHWRDYDQPPQETHSGGPECPQSRSED
jgi:hypothetical protein